QLTLQRLYHVDRILRRRWRSLLQPRLLLGLRRRLLHRLSLLRLLLCFPLALLCGLLGRRPLGLLPRLLLLPGLLARLRLLIGGALARQRIDALPRVIEFPPPRRLGLALLPRGLFLLRGDERIDARLRGRAQLRRTETGAILDEGSKRERVAAGLRELVGIGLPLVHDISGDAADQHEERRGSREQRTQPTRFRR